MLDALAGATTLLFIIAGFCVGLRLLWMGRASKGVAELSLGAGLFLIVGLGLPMQLLGIAVGEGQLGSDPALALWLLPISTVLMNMGWAAIFVFTWRVFRPDSMTTRAIVFVAFGVLLLLCGMAISASVKGVGVRAEEAIGRTLATVLLAQALYLWTTVESLTWWRRMGRRVALGLADPVVANRFLLWGLVGALSFVSLLAPLVFTSAGMDYNESAGGRLLTAVSGLGCAVCLWLAFMPPEAYLRRLRAGALAQTG